MCSAVPLSAESCGSSSCASASSPTPSSSWKENVTRSLWKDRIEVVKQDFLSYQSLDKFDVIVSNPPYFVDSLSCPDQQRNMARHNNSLTYEKLLERVADLLAEDLVGD